MYIWCYIVESSSFYFPNHSKIDLSVFTLLRKKQRQKQKENPSVMEFSNLSSNYSDCQSNHQNTCLLELHSLFVKLFSPKCESLIILGASNLMRRWSD